MNDNFRLTFDSMQPVIEREYAPEPIKLEGHIKSDWKVLIFLFLHTILLKKTIFCLFTVGDIPQQIN